MEVQVGVEPTHDAFAERRVPVSPLHRDWHPLMEFEPPYLRSERSALPLSERGIWSGWQVTILRPPRPKRGALPTELHPADWPSRQESNLHASRFVAGRSSI